MLLTVRANLAAMKTYLYCQILKFIGPPGRSGGRELQDSRSSGVHRVGKLEYDKLHFVSSTTATEVSERQEISKINLVRACVPVKPDAPLQYLLQYYQVFAKPFSNDLWTFLKLSPASAVRLPATGMSILVNTWTWMYLYRQWLPWARIGNTEANLTSLPKGVLPAWHEHNPTDHWQWLKSTWGGWAALIPSPAEMEPQSSNNLLVAPSHHPPRTSSAWLPRNGLVDSLHRHHTEQHVSVGAWISKEASVRKRAEAIHPACLRPLKRLPPRLANVWTWQQRFKPHGATCTGSEWHQNWPKRMAWRLTFTCEVFHGLCSSSGVWSLSQSQLPYLPLRFIREGNRPSDLFTFRDKYIWTALSRGVYFRDTS